MPFLCVFLPILSFLYLCIFVFVQCSAVVWLVVCPHQGRFRQHLGTAFKPSPAPVVPGWHDDNDQHDDDDDGQGDDDDGQGDDDEEGAYAGGVRSHDPILIEGK